MSILENYLHEITRAKKMYHASTHQNMKVIRIKEAEKQSQRGLKDLIWGSPDKEYTAMFCIPGTSSLGFRKGRYAGDKHRTFEIPRKYLSWLKRKCSMYELDPSTFKPEPGRKSPDWISSVDAKVLKEEKYNSAKECLEKHGIKIRVI